MVSSLPKVREALSTGAMMQRILREPFEVTKASDFTDAQIAATWVDLSGGGFFELADPRSPMPLMLLGGKGSGRTHLMRYYSFALQKLRAKSGEILSALRT